MWTAADPTFAVIGAACFGTIVGVLTGLGISAIRARRREQNARNDPGSD